ncbi:MAG: hypothetical protein GEU76_13630 [Alphaproteobacteria bacterium]|jgi:hypothetical protein|nr:hypothetical protein [Alphaproteobacteria bacterium]
MEISNSDGRVTVTLSLSVAEFARALRDGELRLRLGAGAEGAAGEFGAPRVSPAAVAAVCAAYGPESLGANLLWEIAQAGEAGIGAEALKDLLGLRNSKQLAGAFSGLAKVCAREMPGAAAGFIERTWQARDGAFHYRMAAPVRAAVLKALG